MRLDDLLETIQVMFPDEPGGEDAHNVAGWHAVCDEDGIIAYFAYESDALAFRLQLINQRLNGRATLDRYEDT